jgi:hypothetical protein
MEALRQLSCYVITIRQVHRLRALLLGQATSTHQLRGSTSCNKRLLWSGRCARIPLAKQLEDCGHLT